MLVENDYAGGHTFAFEFKYLPKAKASAGAVKQRLDEARKQLERHRASPNLRDKADVDCWAVVFSGPDIAACEKA